MSRRLELTDGGEDSFARLGWRSLEEVFASRSGEVVAESRTSSTVRIPVDASGSVFLKRYVYPSFQMRHALRRSRASREWRCLRRLQGLDIPVPDPLGWGEQRRGLRLLRSFVATRGIEGGANLEEYLRRSDRTGLLVLRELAELAARMHERGFCHGGFRLRNVILHTDGHGDPNLFLIDAPKGGFRARRSDCIVDLATLDQDASALVDEESRLLFLRHYLEHRGWAGSCLQRELDRLVPRIAASRARLDERAARKEARRQERTRHSA